MGKLPAVVTPMVMGKVSKMMEGRTDASGLTTPLGDRSKMAMWSSPEAAEITEQLGAGREGAGGMMGKLKKVVKGQIDFQSSEVTAWRLGTRQAS